MLAQVWVFYFVMVLWNYFRLLEDIISSLLVKWLYESVINRIQNSYEEDLFIYTFWLEKRVEMVNMVTVVSAWKER